MKNLTNSFAYGKCVEILMWSTPIDLNSKARSLSRLDAFLRYSLRRLLSEVSIITIFFVSASSSVKSPHLGRSVSVGSFKVMAIISCFLLATVTALFKRFDDKQRVHPAAAHHPDRPHISGVLQPRHSGQIGTCVCAPVAEERYDFGFKIWHNITFTCVRFKVSGLKSRKWNFFLKLKPNWLYNCLHRCQDLLIPEMQHINCFLRAGRSAQPASLTGSGNIPGAIPFPLDLVQGNGPERTDVST